MNKLSKSMTEKEHKRQFMTTLKATGADEATAKKMYNAYGKPKPRTAVSDALMSVPTAVLSQMIPGGAIVPSLAHIAGLLGDENNSAGGRYKALLPLVGGYRLGNRIKTQVKRELRDIEKSPRNKGARPVAHAVSEYLGGVSSNIGALALGALIGAAVNKKDRQFGGAVGSLIGSGVGLTSTLFGSIMAAIKRRRTKEEQIESDKRSVLPKYIIPGLAEYDRYKRLGRSQGEIEDDRDNSLFFPEKKASHLLSLARMRVSR